MRNTSELYRQLRTELDSWYEVQVIRGPIEYGPDALKSCRITQALFDGNGPQVGGNTAARCSLVVLEATENWPRMAMFVVRVRLRSDDGERISEWLTMGTFYTDEREDDHFGNLFITGFDGMLLLEQSWTDKVADLPENWPITAKAAADLLVEATGIQIDPRTQLDDTVAFIGLDTTSTARQVYASIAAAQGSNWQMTPEGRLRLLPLNDGFPGLGSIAGIAVAGLAIVGTGDDSGATQEFLYLGLAVSSLDTGEPLAPVTGVELETESGALARAGTGTGYVVKAGCAFSDSDAAGLALRSLYGFEYRPFRADGAVLDPAAEVGDIVVIDGVGYQMITADWTLGPDITCDIEAPAETEVDHEYRQISEAARTLRRALAADDAQRNYLLSYIQQTATSIRTGVEEGYISKEEAEAEFAQMDAVIASIQTDLGDNYYTKADADREISDAEASALAAAGAVSNELHSDYYTKTENDETAAALRSSIQLTRDDLTVAMNQVTLDANSRYNEITFFIRYVNGVVIVGASDSPADFRISPQEIAACWNGEATSYWNQDKQRTPKQLEIPVGGSLREGDFIWQPRSSGNLSLMWVGGD